MPDRVGDRRRQRDVVRLVGQVLGEEAPVRAVAEVRLDVGVVVGAPDLLAGAAREGGVDRAAGRREAPARAADEAALLVGLVELERLDEVAELALPAHQRLLEQAGDVGEGMHHQPLADEARTSWPGHRDAAALADSSSSRGVPIALAATTTTRAGSKCSPPSRSIQVAPVARPLASVSIRRTRAPVTSCAPCAIAFGQWVRSVDALAPSLQPDWQVLRWTHGRRPSYGAELIELNSGHQCQPSLVVAARDLQPGRPDRQRRHRRVLGVRRIGRVAGQTGDAEVAVGPVEVRQQLEVVDRPVVGDAVERADAEVGRQRARPGAGEDDRRAADRVVHERRDRRVVLDDRVVLRRGRGCSGWSPNPCAPSAPSRACCRGSPRGRASRPARGRRRGSRPRRAAARPRHRTRRRR